MAKTNVDGSPVDDETAEDATEALSPRSISQDLRHRWETGEFPWWPTRFGRWPDRLFGELGGPFDHIKIEEYVDDETLVVRAELPGVDPDKDIDITVDDGRLVIRGERTSKTEDDTDGYRSEFRYGSFSRVVPLPEGADLETIAATYEDGILEVRVPMAEREQKPVRNIPVARG